MAKDEDIKITISQKGTIPVWTETRMGGGTVTTDYTLKGNGSASLPLGISNEILEEIHNAGKVDDVLVNGVSVVRDKIAYVIVPDSATWGNISGNINDQTDLQLEFATKQDKLTSLNAGENITITPGSDVVIPDLYQAVEYIECNGTQWFDTGFIPEDGMIADVKGRPAGGSFWFGSIMPRPTNPNVSRNLVAYVGGNYLPQKASVFGNSYQKSANEDVEIHLDTRGTRFYATIDNNVVYDLSNTSSLTNQTATVKLCREAYTETISGGRFYSFKIYDSTNTLAVNLIPCYRKTDNVGGFYDAVSGEFLVNQGTGAVIVGPNAPSASDMIISAVDTTYSAGNGLTLSGTTFSVNTVNNVTSTSTTNPLSANMGKELQDEIDNLKARGRFLALWNCATGLAESNPPESPYTYQTGDYFIVGVVDDSDPVVNYRPNGSTYTTGVPSATVEIAEVNIDDVYYYDGTNWKLQSNTQKTVTFANIAGDPYDNSNLAAALNDKQDTLAAGTDLEIVRGSYYTLEYMVGSGTQYIDTGIVRRGEDFIFEAELEFSAMSGDRTGFAGATWAYSSYLAITPSTQTFDVGSSYTTSPISLNQTYKVRCEFYENSVVISLYDSTGTLISTTTRPNDSWPESDMNSWLIGMCRNTNPGNFTYKLLSSKIWKGGTLVFDGIPVQKSISNEVGMYDYVSDLFFRNAGTGSYTAGPSTGEIEIPDQINFTNETGYVTKDVNNLTNYTTTTVMNQLLAQKQDTLVSGTNIKTINNESLLGSGNITIDPLPDQTGQSGKYLTTNGTSASWDRIEVSDVYGLQDDLDTKQNLLTSANAGQNIIITASSIEPRDLPEGYVQLEYIQSDGNQYIDTGVHFLFGDEFYFDYMKLYSVSNEDKGYGAGSDLTRNITGGGRKASNNVVMYICNINANYTPSLSFFTSLTQRYVEHWKITTGKLESILTNVDERYIYTLTANSSTLNSVYDSGNNLFLFKDNSVQFAFPSAQRVYGAWLKRDNNDLALDLVPARRTADDEVGLYDMVSETFLTNLGTGVFVAGPDASSVSGLTISAVDTTYTAGSGLSLNGTQFSVNTINNTTSTSTTNPLSANMGKSLQDQIDNLKARGRFLALWDCSTGLAESNPPQSPYTYQSGDYFIVGTVASAGATNYRPTGSTYTTGVASTVVETEAVDVDDVYYYDGTNWKLQINTQKTVAFVNIAGDPYDNSNLAAALDEKQDKFVAGRNLEFYYVSKNLFNQADSRVATEGVLQEDGSYYLSIASVIGIWTPSNIVPFNGELGTTYTISLKYKTADTAIGVGFYYSDGTNDIGTRGGGDDNWHTSYVTSNPAKQVVGFGLAYGANLPVYIKDIQIEVGSTPTPYVSYYDGELTLGANVPDVQEYTAQEVETLWGSI